MFVSEVDDFLWKFLKDKHCFRRSDTFDKCIVIRFVFIQGNCSGNVDLIIVVDSYHISMLLNVGKFCLSGFSKTKHDFLWLTKMHWIIC